MIDPDRALALVLEHAHPSNPILLPLPRSLGHVLAESVVANRDTPPFDRAMMDGVGVCARDAGKTVEVAGEVPAGGEPSFEVGPGRCVNIMTGAACPPGTEAVVPEEKIRREGNRVSLPIKIKPRENIVGKGSECRAGDPILKEGDVLSSLAVGVLASFGHAEVRVHPLPELALITTGREVKGRDEEVGKYEIRDVNGPMLEALAFSSGVKVRSRLHADDREDSIAKALEQVREADVILFAGGVSAGKYDLVPGQIERYGGSIVFRKVRQKPGKPLLFARKGRQLIFGLPGTPLAFHLCFHRYVMSALQKAAGLPIDRTPWRGILTKPQPYHGDRWLFVLATAERKEGAFQVTPQSPVSTADLFSASQANCYLHVPGGSDGLKAGQAVEFSWLVDMAHAR